MRFSRLTVPTFAVVLVLIVCGCSGGSNGGFRYTGTTKAGSDIALAVRKPAGDISGTLLGGGVFDLRANAGKVTVLSFWASWCDPCRTEAPEYDTLYRSLKSSGVDFVGIDIKETSQAAPASFVTSYGITYPSIYDPDGKSALQLGKLPVAAVGLPWTVLVDKHLKVAAVYVGEQQPADLRPVLSRLASEP
jgi:thiol-disulfide isomerase/thioredoxin